MSDSESDSAPSRGPKGTRCRSVCPHGVLCDHRGPDHPRRYAGKRSPSHEGVDGRGRKHGWHRSQFGHDCFIEGETGADKPEKGDGEPTRTATYEPRVLWACSDCDAYGHADSQEEAERKFRAHDCIGRRSG